MSVVNSYILFYLHIGISLWIWQYIEKNLENLPSLIPDIFETTKNNYVYLIGRI
jgi:ABC-type proline/glycine betaine transport system permease subunit